MFEQVDTKVPFAKREEEILSFWKKNDIFAKSLEQNKNSPRFIFYDGPPFATGLPHYGHLLAGWIKDVVIRYKSMQGFFVPRRFGWDCHGLPVEYEIEKSKDLTGAYAIEEFGVGNFNEECRNIVLRYSSEWKSIVERMGRWVDFDNGWKTMDFSFMESVWWVFKQLYDKGLVYEGFRVMPFSTKLGTTLSNFEASENYKEVDDPSLTVLFPLLDEENAHLLVWTTTPWTLISNLAVAVGPDIVYVKVKEKSSNRIYYLADARLSHYFPDLENIEILGHMSGYDLENRTYEPVFPYFHDEKEYGAFRVLLGDHVTVLDGTGLVHTAPGFGEEDFAVCHKYGIPVVCPVDQNGKFTDEISLFVHRHVKDCDKDIIKLLKQEGKIFRHETIRHRYPFCWRSDTPLIYKAVSTWFVSVEKIKDKIVAANEKIAWVPEHIKHGRFKKWLQGARDWNISRSRYWGTPIPIWRSSDNDIIVVGSVDELATLSGKKPSDLHRHFIDSIEIHKHGKIYKRIPEVFDCWFESGSMPYAQNHYPFENKELFEKSFPADFIAEGLDQTRGWFYTLTILAAALFSEPAFKNVIVNGIVLAEDGQKMSKRLRNYPDPVQVINTYGADAVRLYLMQSPAVKAEDLCFSEHGVDQVLKQILIPLQNAYSFFILYARLYNFAPQYSIDEFTPQNEIDRWILSHLQKLVQSVTNAMERFEISHAVPPIIDFVDQLTNWYIRRSRRRFWSDDDTQDRRDAFHTLYFVLKTFCKVCAPFIPYLSESIYQNLKMDKELQSVHLCRFPVPIDRLIDENLESAMQLVQTVVSSGHALRKEYQIKVRQPLKKAFVICSDEKNLKDLKEHADLIKEELNVCDLEYSTKEEEFVSLFAKPNFRVLGKKIGPLMKDAQKLIEAFDQNALQRFAEEQSAQIEINGTTYTLQSDDVVIDRKVKEGIIAKHSELVTVALDTEIDDALFMLGLAREIVNKVNLMRKEQGFDISDRIHMTFETTDIVKKCLDVHQDYIFGEVLALSCTFDKISGMPFDLNGQKTEIAIKKA